MQIQFDLTGCLLMKGTDPKVLLGELEKGMDVTDGMFLFFKQCLREDIPKLGRSQSGAVLIAGIIDNYYTGLETIFLRISQFFENSLSKDRWHTDLLQRMRISIKDERIKVINDETFLYLDEIRRFRHFNRHYFNFDYDWDRIDFLTKKMHQVHPLLIKDINIFIKFLHDLMSQD